jgi:glycosyltransferase involved in cell wall biosynthesis
VPKAEVSAPFANERIDYALPGPLWWTGHFLPLAPFWAFKKACDHFQPDHVLYVGAAAKPYLFMLYARTRGIRNNFLFYINDFFCGRTYAGRQNGPCSDCLVGGEAAAIRNGCFGFSPSDMLKLAKGAIARALVGKEVRRAHRVLGYSDEQNRLYAMFGVPARAIARIGFQFDPSDLADAHVRDDGYFAITGQPIMQKGVHLLHDVLVRLDPDVRVRMSVRDSATASTLTENCDLGRFVEEGKLTFVTDLRRRECYIDFIAGARGVLILSYYHTTGEFVLQECLRLGKPVHAFNVGAHRDILVDGENASVSEVGDIADFTSKVNCLNVAPEQRARIGAGAARFSRTLYGPDRAALFREVFGPNEPVSKQCGLS